MFGGNLNPPKYIKHTRPKPMNHDIQLPSASCPGAFGHWARQPNTDFHVQNLHYKQRFNDEHVRLLTQERRRLLKEATEAKYDAHFAKTVFQRKIEERFQDKIRAYDQIIEERRERLKELLCREEQEFIQETIDQAQKGVDNKMQEMKIKAQQLRALREEERMAVVKQKRMQQMIDDCQELRPVMIKKNLVESKITQLKQIEENQLKKLMQKDMDHLWYQLMLKEMDAKLDREKLDKRIKDCTMQETVAMWEQQIQDKKLQEQKRQKAAAEERMEAVRIKEQIGREKIEALDAKLRKRDQVAIELRQQIELQEKYASERKKAEEAINKAFNKMAMEEMERERQQIKDTTSLARRETAIYRSHLRQLEEERKEEERRLLELLEEHRQMVEKKQQEAYCKLKEAKEQLKRDVLAGRAEQVAYKRQEAENQLKLKEAENELMRMCLETNKRLQAEHDRLQADAVREYREDLKRQIEEMNEKRKLEREQLEKELAHGLAEEERHRKQLMALFQNSLYSEEMKHPFRRVLERIECPCPENRAD